MYIWKLAYGLCVTSCIAMAVDQHLHNLKVIDLLPKFCLGFVVDFGGQKVVILSEPLDEEEAKKRVAPLQNFDHCRVVDEPVHVRFMKDDNLVFSPSMNFDEEKAKERGINRGDHPPIVPIGKPLSRYAGNLSKEEIEVYHYICRRFLASSMPDYQYSNKKVMLEMGDGHILPYHFA
jgi:hypothetical protein